MFTKITSNFVFKAMDIKVGILLLLCYALSGCYQKCGGDFTYYFTIAWGVENKKDTLSVGDTLWVSSRFSEVMLDTKSNSYVSFGNAKIRSWFMVFPLEPYTGRVAEYYFKSFPTDGLDCLMKEGEEGEWGNTRYAYSNGRYSFRYAFIPKKKGDFCLMASDVGSVSRGGACKEAYIDKVFMPAGRRNVELYYKAYSFPYAVRQNGYCFTVK